MLKQDTEQFLAQKTVALVGLSQNSVKLGNQICQKLNQSGYDVHPVHPRMGSIDGVNCVRSIRELPSDVLALMIVARAEVCADVLKDVSATRIKYIWIFGGKKNDSAVDEQVNCLRGAGVIVISGLCPFLFVEPVKSVHSIHRFFVRLMGNYPKEN